MRNAALGRNANTDAATATATIRYNNAMPVSKYFAIPLSPILPSFLSVKLASNMRFLTMPHHELTASERQTRCELYQSRPLFSTPPSFSPHF